jgi:hypothetical protein
MTEREIVAKTSNTMIKFRIFSILGVLFSFIFYLKSLRIPSTDWVEEVLEFVEEKVIIL